MCYSETETPSLWPASSNISVPNHGGHSYQAMGDASQFPGVFVLDVLDFSKGRIQISKASTMSSVVQVQQEVDGHLHLFA